MSYLLRCLIAVALLLAGLAAPVATSLILTAPSAMAQAQKAVSEPDYEAWQRVAARADEAIETGRASTSALESLRNELADWRQRFLNAQDINYNAIQTVQRQLDALGPAPEDGATEAPEIATERSLLDQRMSRLREPVRLAELAFTRADGLIQGIDRIIRERQTDEIMEFGPSPLNPVHWREGFTALGRTFTTLKSEAESAWSNPIQREETAKDIPAILVFLAIGVVLVARGRKWAHALTRKILGDDPGAARWIVGFIVSMGTLFLPLFGVYFLIEAVSSSGLVGLRGEQILDVLGPLVFTYLLARWLASRVFPAREARTLPLNLSPQSRRKGRFYGMLLGAVASGSFFLQQVGEIIQWSQPASVVILYPLMVLCCLLLFRIANLLREHVNADAADDGEETYRSRMTGILAFLMTALAVIVPVLGAIGYFRLAQALLYPSLGSIELLAMLLVLQRVVVEVYVLITKNRAGAAESLTPILVGLVLVLMSLPVFALIWGARVADLTELYARAAEGFFIGDTRISPTIFLTFAFVFLLGYFATRLLQGALKNTILPKTKIDPGGRHAILSGVGYLGIFLAAVIAITSAGIDLTALGYVAGALSVGIGFGLQNVVSNFVSGIILLVERPISEGDWIEVGGVHGNVKDISVRSTIIQTFDRSDVIVPNADLVSGRVTNYTRGNTVGRLIVPVGVAYGTDTKMVEGILQEVAEAHPLVSLNPPPFVVFRGFGADALDFEIRAILRDVNYILSVHSEMNHEIASRFAEAGIEIPFAQRDIWIRNAEVLNGETREERPAAQATTPPSPKIPSAPRQRDEPPDIDGNADGDGGAAGDGR
jgi:small-conductance mechanosensitive channel